MKKIFFNSTAFIILIILTFLFFVFIKTSFTFSKISVDSSNTKGSLPVYLLPELEDLPDQKTDQVNILLLGIRGEGDPFGGLLTDALMLVSLNQKTNKVALISLPRDLYIPLPNSDKRDKLNAVYAWGYEKGGVGTGINYIKDTISRITGLYVSNAIIINFKAFEEFIDAIGGVDVNLKADFIEDKQWWCDTQGQNCRAFFLPKGKNHLNGETALFYVRSRFSSSDFDRARRQQEVFLAVKQKVFSLGFIANPLNALRMLDLLGNNVRSDMGINKMTELITYAKKSEISLDDVTTFVFDNTSEEGILYAKYLDGRYILLPKTGNFSEIKKKCLELTE